jgi:predicted metal-dependent hydrolase
MPEFYYKIREFGSYLGIRDVLKGVDILTGGVKKIGRKEIDVRTWRYCPSSRNKRFKANRNKPITFFCYNKPMEIEVIKSKNRRKTISARLVNNIMRIQAPASIREEKLDEIIASFKKRFEKRQARKELNSENLFKIAQRLNKKYFDGKIEFDSIEYTENQNRLFGSCNFRTKTLRISHRLVNMPDWVRDYVIIHEMAHILEPNHGKSFWELVNRYELSERARGFLMAFNK